MFIHSIIDTLFSLHHFYYLSCLAINPLSLQNLFYVSKNLRAQLLQKTMSMLQNHFEIVKLTECSIWVLEVYKKVDELVIIVFLINRSVCDCCPLLSKTSRFYITASLSISTSSWSFALKLQVLKTII